MEKIIHFPDFERDLTSHACYPQGRYLFTQHYQADVNQFPNGIWVVLFPNAPPPMQKFKICIQISKHKVTTLSCTCHKNENCEHTICALFYIRDKFVDSDVESVQDSVDYEDNVEEEQYSGTNSFIDDREESEITVVEEEENAENGANKIEDDIDEQERTLYKEFQCQICLEDMEVPVLFPCFSHSVCYVCAVQLFEKAQGSFDGTKKLNCPVCGDKYFFRVKEADELRSRINKGLKRMIFSYKQEKSFWEKNEQALKEKIREYEERLGIKQEVEEEKEESRSQEEEIVQRKPRIDDNMEEEEKLYELENKQEDNNYVIKKGEEDICQNGIESDPKIVNSGRKQDLTEEESECLVSKRKRYNPLLL